MGSGRTKRSAKQGAKKMVASRGGDEGRAIVNRQRGVKLAVAPLRKFLRHVCDGLGLAETELVICFVTDAEMARMNWAFRKKRGPTDVLSFPAVKQKTRRGGVGLRAGVRVGGIAASAKLGKSTEAGTKARPLLSQEQSQRQSQKQIRRQKHDALKGVATKAGGEVIAAGYLGDIAIAPATARRYAKKNGRSFAGELRVLMLHGVLHLLGYDHESDGGEMDRLEKKLRRRFGIA